MMWFEHAVKFIWRVEEEEGFGNDWDNNIKAHQFHLDVKEELATVDRALDQLIDYCNAEQDAFAGIVLDQLCDMWDERYELARKWKFFEYYGH